MRRFLSNYFDLLFVFVLEIRTFEQNDEQYRHRLGRVHVQDVVGWVGLGWVGLDAENGPMSMSDPLACSRVVISPPPEGRGQ